MLFSFSEAQFCFRGSTGYAFPILGSTALLLLYLGMCFLIFGKQKLRFSWKHGLCFFFKCASILPENGSTGCAFLSFFEDQGCAFPFVKKSQLWFFFFGNHRCASHTSTYCSSREKARLPGKKVEQDLGKKNEKPKKYLKSAPVRDTWRWLGQKWPLERVPLDSCSLNFKKKKR